MLDVIVYFKAQGHYMLAFGKREGTIIGGLLHLDIDEQSYKGLVFNQI